MESKSKQVLIIDDEPEMIEILSHQISDLGFKFSKANNGVSGLEMALGGDFDLIILDLGLPGLGGKEVCKRLRAEYPLLPILVVTGESSEASTVLTLELGADEYITKPIRPLEFRARVNALLRRLDAQNTADTSKANPTNNIIEFRDILIDKSLQQTTIKGTTIDLTRTEFELLLLFIENGGRILSREQIVESLWGQANYSYEQNIRTTISRLRTKLEAKGDRAPYIVTQRGFGYRLANDDD